MSTGSGPVILDLQALQSADHRARGIGRWVRDYTRELGRQRPDLLGGITWNPRLPPPEGIDALGCPAEFQPPGELAGRSGIYHLLSPFELAESVEGIWPASVRDGPIQLVVTLYDLIPLVFPARYLAEAGRRRRYRTRVELLRAAQAVLTISGATRSEALARLGLDPSRVSSIGTGISAQFTPGPPGDRPAPAVAGLRPGEPFLLCLGGEDERKNIEGLLRGYALLPEALRTAHRLVIVFELTEGYRRHLGGVARSLGIGDRVVLAVYVDDATLIALYRAAALFVFPSLYEGFGLPVAEAMACGAAVVSSNAAALAEIAEPAGVFDPGDPASMADTMARGLVNPEVRSALLAASRRPAPTWAGVVARAARVYEQVLAAG